MDGLRLFFCFRSWCGGLGSGTFGRSRLACGCSCSCGYGCTFSSFRLRRLLTGRRFAMGHLDQSKHGGFFLAPFFLVFQNCNALRPFKDVAVPFQGAFSTQTRIQRHDIFLHGNKALESDRPNSNGCNITVLPDFSNDRKLRVSVILPHAVCTFVVAFHPGVRVARWLAWGAKHQCEHQVISQRCDAHHKFCLSKL